MFKSRLMWPTFALAAAMSSMVGLPNAALAASSIAAPAATANSSLDSLSRRDWQQIEALLSAAPPTQQAYLKASNTSAGDQFARAVAVSGDTVVVGAPYEDSSTTGVNSVPDDSPGATDSGAAYVFTRSGTTWSQQAYLKASNTGAGDAFGLSISLSGDTIVVGAVGESSNATGVDGNQADDSLGDAGAAYVFTRSGTTWSQQAYLKASNTDGGDSFGWSVSTSANTAVVGAPNEGSGATGVNGDQTDDTANSAGAAYVFTRSGTTWSQQAYLKASNTNMFDLFGASVAASLDSVVVGATGEDSIATGVNGDQTDESAGSAGAAYVFTRSGTNWSQQAYLKASNTNAGDAFGEVAISADTAVVGAAGEASSATGVNGLQTDNSTDLAGAAYVFTRSGTNWSQQAYLKASNTGMFDNFGTSVAVSADMVVVGAPGEASNATGVNGAEGDNSKPSSGAAYVFTRSGTTWSQHAYLKASNTGTLDSFGTDVGAGGDTVVVGATVESSSATGIGGDQADNSADEAGAAYVFRQPQDCQPGYYSATGDDSGGPCTAASVGYYVASTGATTQTPCPHGTTTAATASDSASDCIPLTPYAKKQGASAALKALIPTGWAPSDELLTKATFRIDQSLATWRWLDASTLNPLHGYRVFNSERKTVRFLTNPLFYGNATVSTAITDLVSADREIVVKAIASSSDPAAIALANTKLALADARIAAGQYGPAIKALKFAWLAVV